MFKRIINSIRGARLWNQALDASAEGRSEDALRCLDAMPILGGLKTEVDMLRAYLLRDTGKLQISYDLCEQLVRKLSHDQALDDNVRKYATSYVRWLAQLNYDELFPKKENLRPDWLRMELDGLDMTKVPTHWQLNFPLRIHPDFKEQKS